MEEIKIPKINDEEELSSFMRNYRKLQKEGVNVATNLEKIKSNKNITIIYRQNDFIDKVVKLIDDCLSVNVRTVKIPKNTTKLTDKQKKFIEIFMDENEKDEKVYVDKTTEDLLGYKRFAKKKDWIFKSEEAEEGKLSDAQKMAKKLEDIGKKVVEEYGFKKIVLISGSEGEYFLPCRLAEHQLAYIAKDGTEKKIDWDTEGLRSILKSNEDYREIIDFFIKHLEKGGAKVYIGFDNVKTGMNPENREFKIYESDLTYNGNFRRTPADIGFIKDAAILVDRHQYSGQAEKYGAVFLKHELSTIEEKTTGKDVKYDSEKHSASEVKEAIKKLADSLDVKFPSKGFIEDYICGLESNLGYMDVTEIKEIGDNSNEFLVKLMNENGVDKGHDSLYHIKIDFDDPENIIKAKKVISTEDSGEYIHLDLLKPIIKDDTIEIEYKGKTYSSKL